MRINNIEIIIDFLCLVKKSEKGRSFILFKYVKLSP